MSDDIVKRLREWNRQYEGKMPNDMVIASDLIESLRQQLLSSQKREVMLRYAISWCSKVTVDLDIHDALDHALSATTDIDGLILCHAEPAAIVYRDYGGNGAILQTELADDEPLYRAWEPKT